MNNIEKKLLELANMDLDEWGKEHEDLSPEILGNVFVAVKFAELALEGRVRLTDSGERLIDRATIILQKLEERG